MNLLIIISLILKIIGSILEILSQAMISRLWSIESYGTYSFFISVTDILYSVFLSGIIKFNNYYIPQKQDISKFKRNLYTFYALPIFCAGMILRIILKNNIIFYAFISGFAYFCAMDNSSSMMSYGHYVSALLGEYCIGRAFIIVFVLAASKFGVKAMGTLYIGYFVQFIFVILYYRIAKRKIKEPAPERNIEKGAAKKYAVFQTNDIAHTIVINTSVIVQYLFSNAYQTALVSIVLVVRKFINFITGPTSKLYQPEFSRRYKENDKAGLCEIYAQITRTQLCFMMPVFVLLISSPGILLKIYSNELVSRSALVVGTSFVFLFMISFGPLTNFLCMTGHEKIDTISNWLSVAVMYAVMALTRANELFVVFGFCAQTIFSTVFKLIVYISCMKQLTMPLKDYIKLSVIFAASVLMVKIMPANIFISFVVCAANFILNFILVFPRQDLLDLISKVKKR